MTPTDVTPVPARLVPLAVSIAVAIPLAACGGSGGAGAGAGGAEEPAREPAAEPRHDVAFVKDVAAAAGRARLLPSGEPIELSPEQAEEIARVVAACEPHGSWAATTPPWPGAVIELIAPDGRRAAFQLVAQQIRIDQESPYAPTLESITDESGATVHDCTLSFEDSEILWSVHEEHLGPTRTKEYKSKPAPSSRP